MSSAPNNWRQIGALAIGNIVSPISDTISRRGSRSGLSWPACCAAAKRLAIIVGSSGPTWWIIISRSAPPSHRISRTHSVGSHGCSATTVPMPCTKPATSPATSPSPACITGARIFATTGSNRSVTTASCSCALSPK